MTSPMFQQTVTCVLSRLGLDQWGVDSHPRQPAPMLLPRANKMFASPDWVYEPKGDGFRTLTSPAGRGGPVDLTQRPLVLYP
jgi:hypothetical protein